MVMIKWYLKTENALYFLKSVFCKLIKTFYSGKPAKFGGISAIKLCI